MIIGKEDEKERKKYTVKERKKYSVEERKKEI